MPELPEISLYVDAIAARVRGQRLERLRIRSPSFLHTYDPPAKTLEGLAVEDVRRLGKRIVLAFEDDLFAVIHLMITGRFQWRAPDAKIHRKTGHAAFDFESGALLVTEQGTKKRATLHVLRGEAGLAAHHRGGVEPMEVSLDEFKEALGRENRTLKRALTDPRLISGIGNAHSDEILLEARLSPLKLTSKLDESEIERLHAVTQSSLARWTAILREEWKDRFPSKVTAFHPKMAAHGRYGHPCPQCGSPIQRIVYAARETNYCPTCQTGGKLLADRAISRLLRQDWPRTLEELEQHVEERTVRRGASGGAREDTGSTDDVER